MNKDLQNTNLNSTHERLKFLRSIVKFDRKTFAARHDIPEITLRLWENGKLPITDKAIERCISAYKKEGIDVKEKWLKEGTGTAPGINYAIMSFLEARTSDPDLLQNYIEDDFLYFSNKYPDCISFKIISKEMEPTYKAGDFVIGRKNSNLQKIHNQDSIVLLENGTIVFRRAFVTSENKINLACINPISSGEILFDAQIISIAPVIIHYIA